MIRRFEKKYIVSDTGCWIWMASLNNKGYGQFRVSYPVRTMEFAHRMSWKLYKGEIPDGKFVLHRCDVPACVKPEHLFLGDQAANISDMVEKGRYNGGPASKVGIRCVHKAGTKWRAITSRPSRRVLLYSGPDFFEACCARKSWEAKQGLAA